MFLQVLIMASAFPCFSLIQHGGKPAEKQIGHFRNISCSQCVASAFRCPDPSRKVTRFSPQNFHIFVSNIHRQYAFQKHPSFALAKIGGKPAEKQIGHLRNISCSQCVQCCCHKVFTAKFPHIRVQYSRYVQPLIRPCKNRGQTRRKTNWTPP
jgi:hypothetical protein